MRLETERLWLRELQADDLPALVSLWSDPDVTRYAGGPREAAGVRGALEEDLADPSAETYNLWPVEEKETGEVIGHCGLLDKEIDGVTEIELAYFLACSAWGNGYATEIACALRDHAFQAMGLPRLISLIDPENVASERVAAKVGMSLEREIARPGGEARRVYAIERADEAA
jgi:ribosomal-protein-alanine N-acetyltransferase